MMVLFGYWFLPIEGWCLVPPKNMHHLALLCNKYPLQRDIFCLEASLCVGLLCGALLHNVKLCFWLSWKRGWLGFGLVGCLWLSLVNRHFVPRSIIVLRVYSSTKVSSYTLRALLCLLIRYAHYWLSIICTR
jgi:hypothetical protein